MAQCCLDAATMYGANLSTIPEGVDGRAALDEVQRRVAGPEGPARGSQEAAVPYLRSEHMLVRFLIARQWDVDKAMGMLKEHYRWLAEMNMTALLQDPFPEEAQIKKYYPMAFHGVDKKGRPLYIERPGLIDMPRLLQITTPERLLQYVSTGCELQIRRRLPACSLLRGEVVDKSLNIMDLDGLGFRVVTHTIARRVLKDVVTILQNHYPECAGRTIIINAPRVFSIAWSFVKPMLDEKTVSKISIFGTDKEAYSAALLEIVDANQLPALFGGRCMCDGKDALSCMRSVKGPWADPEVTNILDREALHEIMTPEGAKMLHEQRARERAARGEAEGAEAPEPGVPEPEPGAVEGPEPNDAESAGAAPPSGEPSPVSGAGRAEPEEEAEGEERDSFAAELAELPSEGRRPAGAVAAELERAELEATLLQEEYRQQEEAHMHSLSEWVCEFNNLKSEIGRQVIERAQGYYDSRALWQQAVQEYARQQEEVTLTNGKLEAAVRSLAKAEAAFVKGEAAGLSEKEWAELAPLPEEEEGCPTGTATAAGSKAAVGQNPRLIQTLRLSAQADKVASLQWHRDVAAAELAAKHREIEECRRRYEQEDLQHSACTWNCSVKRAAPFYEKRRMHETAVDAQLAILRSIERRLQQARQHVAALQIQAGGSGGRVACVARIRSRQLDEMSLQSFEIAGGQPGQDEFLSCGSGQSDDGA